MFKGLLLFLFTIFLSLQVVICHNNTYKYDDCSKILLHELIHAFDSCRAHLDFTNKNHVACTEVTLASLSEKNKKLN